MGTEKKKPTNGQLQRRIDRAVIHIDRTKDTQSVYFSDKGMRITIDNEYAVITTGYHHHVFSSFTSSGISRPYLYAKRFVNMANDNLDEIKTKSGYSYERLFAVLKAKDDQTQYNIAQYVDWWLFNIFAPLYEIGETEAETFFVYETFVRNLSRQNVILDEKTDGMTNHQFLKKVMDMENEMVSSIPETVIFKKISDEELVKQEVDAINEQEINESLEASNEGN